MWFTFFEYHKPHHSSAVVWNSNSIGLRFSFCFSSLELFHWHFLWLCVWLSHSFSRRNNYYWPIRALLLVYNGSWMLQVYVQLEWPKLHIEIYWNNRISWRNDTVMTASMVVTRSLFRCPYDCAKKKLVNKRISVNEIVSKSNNIEIVSSIFVGGTSWSWRSIEHRCMCLCVCLATFCMLNEANYVH